MSTRSSSVVDVHVIFAKGGMVLLGLRQNTGYMDGLFHLPSGHLEDGESGDAAAAREVCEEVGVVVDPSDLDLVHVMHQNSGGSRIGLFFRSDYSGTFTNREPDKCLELDWFPLTDLPSNIVPYAAHALRAIGEGQIFTPYGW